MQEPYSGVGASLTISKALKDNLRLEFSPDLSVVSLKGPPRSFPSDPNDDELKGAPEWAPFLQTPSLLVFLEAAQNMGCNFDINPNTEDF